MIELTENKQVIVAQLQKNALQLILQAISQLSQASDIHKEVHETRKVIKKIRSILLLLKYNMQAHDFKLENKKLRNINRRLAPLRDIRSQIEIFEKLLLKPEFENFEQINSILARLHIEKAKIADKFFHQSVFLKQTKALQKVLYRLEKTGLNPDSSVVYNQGLASTYNKAQTLFNNALAYNTSHHFHEFRKYNKYLSNQLLFLPQSDNALMIEMKEKLVVLSGYLGDEHDLSIVTAALETHQPVNGALHASLKSEILQLRFRIQALASEVFNANAQSFIALLQ